MLRKSIIGSLVFLALVALPALSNASITTYFGQDDGAPIGGPFTSSNAAASTFLAAAGALGPVNTITFEDLATGYYTPFAAAPGVTVTLSNVDPPLEIDGYGGISDTNIADCGNSCGFNTTPGGSKWLGFPEPGNPGGSATFAFATPTHSFGLYMTGLQTEFTLSVTYAFSDPTSQLLSVPTINTNGGVEFFGFADPGASISSITITDNSLDGNVDFWGIDDVSYNGAPAGVPEPLTLLFLAPGFLGLAALKRRFKG